jgi:hypothetical protein
MKTDETGNFLGEHSMKFVDSDNKKTRKTAKN